MSFRDSSNLDRADQRSIPSHSPGRSSDLRESFNQANEDKSINLLSESSGRHQGAHELKDPVTDRSAVAAPPLPEINIKNVSSGSPRVILPDDEENESDAFSDAASVQSKSDNRPASSCYGSVHSSAGCRHQLRQRVIYPSAPITFIKGLSGGQPWESFTHTPSGYLDEATVRAAAAADEGIARRQQLKHAKRDVSADRFIVDGSKDPFPETSEALSVCQKEKGDDDSDPAMMHSGVSPPPHVVEPIPISDVSSTPRNQQDVQRGSIAINTNAASSGKRNPPNHKPLLGSWIIGGGGAGTEIERLLKEEREIAEALAARNELTERKLLQEDMEAMIDNLQQVKGFLVKKLRECETALLTTAQERDGLEATLQHVQSGIQDTIAEHRALVDDYKSQLTAKTEESEDLASQLKKTTEENERLKKENKTLLNEVAVARAEVSDVMAARGFHMEEYQHAVQALMERNKAQHRELKRLRAQLIKSREDYANVLARVDELESLTDYQRNELQSIHQTNSDRPIQSSSSWRSAKVLQERRTRSPGSPDRSQQSSDASSPISSQKKSEKMDFPPLPSSWRDESTSHVSSSDVVVEGETDGAKLSQGGKRSLREASKNLRNLVDSTTTDSRVPAACPATRSSLGRSVTGLLASSVSRVLQTFEHAVATDRELQEALDQESDEAPEAAQPIPLHEEAALFLKRTSESGDMVVQLEDGPDLPRADAADDEPSETTKDTESSTLGNVARTVWQAANEMLAERAMPMPSGRLSTSRAITGSTPSAWEVILERHRAAKSMPLFSSLPPTAFPLVSDGRVERREAIISKSSSAVVGASAAKPMAASFAGTDRRSVRQPPSIGSFTVTHHHPGERGNHHPFESQQRNFVSVELCSEPKPPRIEQQLTSDPGEVVVWHEEDIPSSSNCSISAGLGNTDDGCNDPTPSDRSCRLLETPTCEIEHAREEEDLHTTESEKAEPELGSLPSSAKDLDQDYS